MRRFSFFEQRQQFVLRPVEAPHAAVSLSPHDEIERGQAKFRSSGEHGRMAAPVDECAENAALAKARRDSLHPRDVEGEELGIGHFARRHGELPVRASADVSGDANVVGFVG